VTGRIVLSRWKEIGINSVGTGEDIRITSVGMRADGDKLCGNGWDGMNCGEGCGWDELCGDGWG